MEYEVKKLISDGDRIFCEDGEYICTVSMTQKAKALLDNDGWDKEKESWLDYRDRTLRARDNEKQKRKALVYDYA